MSAPEGEYQSAGELLRQIEAALVGAKTTIELLQASEEAAWGLIANAYGGNWDLATPASGWKAAAERWRDAYLQGLSPPPTTESGLAKYQCGVCGNKPDSEGVLQHGRGCFTLSEEGGGEEYVGP